MPETEHSKEYKRLAIIRPMTARDPEEDHRPATPLELLYDLVFVVAIAQAAVSLHHAISHGHGLAGAISFSIVFAGIWWAWMNFTWFASAFDTDDTPYRLKVFVQLIGLLVLAAGVPRVFESHDFTLMVVGYVIMRIGLVAQWLRAARADPLLRKTCLRYAVGISLCQAGWVGLLFLPAALMWYAYFLLFVLELIVPVWGEAARGTTWHRHHIAERYGLLTIIVIGESVLAATLAVQAAIDAGHASAHLWLAIAAAPLIFFSMWWLYFAQPFGEQLSESNRQAFLWGYAHYFIFASAAAVGAGLAVVVDHATQHTEIGAFWAAQAVAIPTAIFLVSLCAVSLRSISAAIITAGAALFLVLSPFVYPSPIVVGLTLVLLTAHAVMTGRAVGDRPAS